MTAVGVSCGYIAPADAAANKQFVHGDSKAPIDMSTERNTQRLEIMLETEMIDQGLSHYDLYRQPRPLVSWASLDDTHD